MAIAFDGWLYERLHSGMGNVYPAVEHNAHWLGECECGPVTESVYGVPTLIHRADSGERIAAARVESAIKTAHRVK